MKTIAQTLCVGTVEDQRNYAAREAQRIAERLDEVTAERDALKAALLYTLEVLSRIDYPGKSDADFANFAANMASVAALAQVRS